MGLSSSQARLLTLTSRMHDIEYKAAKLEAQKLQMANESRKAYEDYLIALDATKVQMKTIATDGSLKYEDATYQKLINSGYEITFKNFGYGLDHDIYENFVRATHDKTQFGYNNREYFAALQTGKTTPAEGLQTKGSDGAYEIYTSKQLAEILNSDRSNITIRLMNDIDVSRETLASHNITNCTFDGNGHSITGLKKSLFGSIEGSNVSNLKLSGDITSGKGMLSYYVKSGSNITNVSASGSIYTPNENWVGGLVSSASDSTFKQCAASINVTGSQFVGGFVSSMNNCTIENCSSAGTIYGEIRAGGFASNVDNSQISKSSSDCSITVNSNNFPRVLSPTYQGNHPDSGAFIAGMANTTVDQCVARGSITDLSGVSNVLDEDMRNKPSVITGFIGILRGDVGQNNTITNCDSYADVTTTYTTHLCGFASNYSTGSTTEISHCNYYGKLSLGDGSSSYRNADFVEAANYDITLSECYSNSNICVFAQGDTKIHGQTTNAASAYTNTINVAAPTIQTNKPIGSEGDTWRILFDNAIAKGGAEVYDLSDANPYGLNEHKNDCEWLTNLINEGYAYLYKIDASKGETYQISVATDTGLQEVSNDKDLRKAEAKYEADMKKIDQKDRRYDTELAALDNERNAIKSEMETLKSVSKDNVERTFKLFS